MHGWSRWFLLEDIPPAQQVAGGYDPWLVALSVCVAVMASWAAMQLATGARHAKRPAARWAALGSGALALGAGVWSMHFIGMLAFQLCTDVDYAPGATLLSMLPSLLASTIALRLIARPQISGAQLLLGGTLVGAGIGAMHYGGMLAMRMDARLAFDPRGFAASIVLAVALAVLALWIRFGLAHRLRLSGQVLNLLAGSVMGLAITGMHYTGMASARFIGDTDPAFDATQDPQTVLALGIAFVAVTIGALAVTVHALLRAQQLNQRLRDSDNQYRTLIANMPGVAFRSEAGVQTRLRFVSERIEQLTGWPAADFISGRQSFDALVDPDDCRRAQRIMADALAHDRPYAIEYRITRRDGQERWVSETAGGGRDAEGQLRWIDGVMRDITEKRVRSMEFETSATVLCRAMAVLEIDPDGRILRCNDNYVAMLGYARADELIGRPYVDMMPLHQRASPDQLRTLEALRRGEVLAGEFERVGKDGRELWVQATYNPVFDSAGRLVKMMAFKTDVTPRKTMERELRQAKARAEQAAQARSSFLANMSHEIRTPMNAILGFTDVLLNTALAPPQRRHLETVRQAGQSLLGLLNDILDTAKLEKGAVELEISDFSLQQLCTQVAASMRLAAEKKGLALTLAYPTTLPNFHLGDALRIQQVLVNLVGNAIKFTHKGRIAITVDQRAGMTVIAVDDTGIGIAPDRVERIFDAFAQADATITRQFGGTGLGTTIARQLTQLMGGHIVVHSEQGVGSRFEVHLPLPRGQAPRADATASASRLPPLSVLVADDVPQNVELLELLLQADGHSVRSARNGREALAQLEAQRFDLVLMDMHMPELDGLGATRALRTRERDQGLVPTPVIALTASVQAADRLAAQQAGMDGFATKPIVTAQLFAEIARVLGLQAAPTATRPPVMVDSGALVDWTQGLTLWRTRERLHGAIANFMQAQAGTAPELRAALGREDAIALAALAHRIGGAAGNLALPSLRLAAQALERAARAGDAAAMQAGGPALLAQLDAVAALVPADPSQQDAPPSDFASLDPRDVLADLHGLQRALQRNELDEDALHALAEVLPAAEMRQLTAAIDNFDFEAAVRCVDQLRASLRAETESLE